MCFIRKALDWVFTQTELKWLDDIMPELHKREKEDKNKEKEQQQKEEVQYCFPVIYGTPQPRYNTVCYNTVLGYNTWKMDLNMYKFI